jgi:DNA-binding MarR family transcriptional regulator
MLYSGREASKNLKKGQQQHSADACAHRHFQKKIAAEEGDESMPSDEQLSEMEEGMEQDTHWLTLTEMRTWVAFWGAIYVVNAALDRDLRAQSELSHSNYLILATLCTAPANQLRMSELANRLFRSRSRLTYEIIQLERAGLVRREDCPTDKRGAVAVLTREGLHMLRTIAPRHTATIRRAFFDQLTDEQIQWLDEALWTIVSGHGKAESLESFIEREMLSRQDGRE